MPAVNTPATITPVMRKHVAAAAAQGLPYAVWQLPGTGAFRAAISTVGARERAIFGDEALPFFALGRFETADATRAEAIDAEIVIDADGARYWDGARYADRPTTEAQRALAEAPDGGAVHGPQGVAPRQTGEARYREVVATALEAMARGDCRKIVLSRAEERPFGSAPDLLRLAEALAARHPGAFVALAATAAAGAWITATPETFLRVGAERVETMALAGTQWPDPDGDIAALTWPAKIVEEQRLVAVFVREAFHEADIAGVSETPAHTVQAARLCHLRSDFSAPRQPGDRDALSRLVGLLHPTPAVCGLPRPAAHAFLQAHEGYDRGCYTGYLGPVGFDGRTDLFVNLRSAQLLRDSYVLYVGGGLVEGSDPAVEWRETVEKSRTIGDVLGQFSGGCDDV